jgi:hypothetical protein
VDAILPHTEADPVALLTQLLAAIGDIAGDHAYFMAEADRHYPMLYITLVGDSAKAGKGTSWGRIVAVLRRVAEAWLETHVSGGLSSGEGLIHAVRDYDPAENLDKNGRSRPPEELQTDKRLLIQMEEFATALKNMARDGKTLRTLTKHAPERATRALIAIITHITREELVRCLTEVDQANGLGNRFLWFFIKRSKLLPYGGAVEIPALEPLVAQLGDVLKFIFGLQDRHLALTRAAGARWEAIYAASLRTTPDCMRT